MVIDAPLIAKKAQAGQFIVLRVNDNGERIPLTIADYDRERGTITLAIQAVGKTTKQMQQECKVGTHLYGMVGPMGIPSPISHAKKVLCVGGGLGVAPVFPQARGFKEAGAYVIKTSAPGYYDSSYHLTIRPRQPVSAAIELQPTQSVQQTVEVKA
jgi:NAD(P)H-flavin reductase